MDLTPENPWEAKAVLVNALADGKVVTLDSFGCDANLGGDTLIFKIGDSHTLTVSPFWLDDINIDEGPWLDEETDEATEQVKDGMLLM
jgi:hypothetical protein